MGKVARGGGGGGGGGGGFQRCTHKHISLGREFIECYYSMYADFLRQVGRDNLHLQKTHLHLEVTNLIMGQQS